MSKSPQQSSLVVLCYTPKKEVKLTAHHKHALEKCFKNHPRPSQTLKRQLSQSLGLPVPTITRWFHARRAKVASPAKTSPQVTSQVTPRVTPRDTPQRSRDTPEKVQLASLKDVACAPLRTDPLFHCLSRMTPSAVAPSFSEDLRLPSLHMQTIPKFSAYFS